MSVLTDLMALKKEELQKMAAELSLPSGERLSKKELISRIISAQKKAAKVEPVPAAIAESISEVLIEKPKFEQLTAAAEEIPVPETEEADQERRGGVRPGAGRPKGSTAEICAVRALPEQPNESIQAALELLFVFWAAKKGIKELRLTKEEAVALALPLTQGIELHFPGLIPQSLKVYIMLIWSIYEVFDNKIAVIRKFEQQKSQNVTDTNFVGAVK